MRKIYLYKGKLFEEIHDFRYTGDFQEFHLDKGKYLMLCDGARSENPGYFNYRAYGGRAMGILDLMNPSTFYAAVGGEGKAAPDNTSVGLGGWNGGGNGGLSCDSSYRCGLGGGGASDIRISNTNELYVDPRIREDFAEVEGYTQVQYISTKGTGTSSGAHIILDYIPITETRVKTRLNWHHNNIRYTDWCALFGSRLSNGQDQFCIFTTNGSNNDYLQFYYGNSGVTTNTFPHDTFVDIEVDKNHLYWASKDVIIDMPVTSSVPLVSAQTNMVIFGMHEKSNGNNVFCHPTVDCEYFKIYENDILKFDLIPCYRNSDKYPGLYDMVNNKFYAMSTNSSSYVTYEEFNRNIYKGFFTRIIVGGGAGGPGRLNSQNLVTNVEWIASGGGTIGTPAGGETSSKSFASQSSGYSFGIGQQPIKRGNYSYGCEGAGGGGGGWFGGYSDAALGNYSAGSGGGGSSYVLTESSWKPDGYLVGEEFYFTDPFMDTGVAEYARIIVAKEVSTLMKDDEIYAFCTGEMEKLPLNGNSKLQIECYGGAGGARVQYSKAAKGGYAKGTVNVSTDDEVYITVGGTGLIHNVSSTANNQRLRPTLSFNGGGMCGVRNNVLGACGPGGGASDVRICPNAIKPKLPSEINYIKTMFYERRVEYNFEPDPGSNVPWFHITSLKFFNGVDQINMVETEAYIDEECTKRVTYASGQETAENVSLIHTGTNVFACKWEGLVNVVMKLDEPVTDIDSYSINLPNTLNNARLPAAWKIYVSEDGTSWTLLDNRLITNRTVFGNQVFTKSEFEFKDKPTLHNRVIVAGGGGGQARYDYIGGVGGGETGGSGDSASHQARSGPGLQMEAPYNTTYGKFGCDGVFGHGGMGYKYSDSYGYPGGGGGWFGGSGIYYSSSSVDSGSSGCGGSGYLLTKDSWKPACYGLDSKYYLSDTEMISGGNPLPVPMTMVKITVLEYAPVSILAGDVDGIKYFDVDENKWVPLSTNTPTIEDFNNHGFSSIPNENGLMNNYRIYAISKLDSFVPDKLIYNVTPSKLKIHHTGKTSMRVRKLSVDIEYNQLETSVDATSTKVGVGPTSHLDIDVIIDKHSVNTVEQLYSVYLEADLAATGNRYIPPKEKSEDEETSKPVPKPGDDDYLKKYLLQVGARNSIPRSFEQYQFNYNNQAISSVIETCSKVYNREIYTMTRLTFGSTVIHRLTKYNTITKKSVIIRDFTNNLFGGYGIGDFEKFGNKFVFTPGYNNSYAYWYVYDQVNNTITTIDPSSSNYWVNAFGRSFKLNENEIVFLGRYGLITYNVIKNTYTLSSGISQYARDFAMGKKYYLVTYDSSTAYFVDKETKAATAITLTANTSTVCTYANGKFFVAQNGWLHVYDEETKSLEKQVVVPWSNCRSISYNAGVVYVTTNNSSRVWFYHFGDQRYDSIHLPWNLTFTNNGEIMRGCIFNNSWWIGHWTMASVSYVGSAKYNFGQRYGQYQIGFNSETIDDLEYDDRFVTKEDTHLNIHDGDITYEGTSLGDSNIRVFNVSRGDYNIYKYNSFTMIDENEI